MLVALSTVAYFAIGRSFENKKEKTNAEIRQPSENEQTPLPIVFEGCGGDGGGVVFDNSIKCPSCCAFAGSAQVAPHVVCYNRECDAPPGTEIPGGTCGDCIKIDDNPGFDPTDPTSPPYRIYVYSSGQTFYVFTYSTVQEDDGMLISFTTE